MVFFSFFSESLVVEEFGVMTLVCVCLDGDKVKLTTVIERVHLVIIGSFICLWFVRVVSVFCFLGVWCLVFAFFLDGVNCRDSLSSIVVCICALGRLVSVHFRSSPWDWFDRMQYFHGRDGLLG